MKPETPQDPTSELKVRALAVREQFKRDGISIAAWAAARNLSTPLIYEVLKGERPCVRGESHRAAVLLGIKPGNPAANPQNYDPRTAAA